MPLEFGYDCILNDISHKNCGTCAIGLYLDNELVIITKRNLNWDSLLLIFLGSQIFDNLFVLGVINHIFVLGYHDDMSWVAIEENQLLNLARAYFY